MHSAAELIKLSKKETEQTVIFYCYFPSHYQNIKRIPTLIKRKFPNFNVILLCYFGENDYSTQEDDSIIVRYSVAPACCNFFSARLFITPMVGFPRSLFPKGAIGIHFLVSLAGIEGVYLDHHFDSCNYVFCASEAQIDDFKKLSHRRSINSLKLLRGGYPKLDDQIELALKFESTRDDNTVIYAPTHVYEVNSRLASLIDYGEPIVDELLRNGITTIFRPHPTSMLNPIERRAIDRICEKHVKNQLFAFDTSNDYIASYAKASLMITDLSGTGFTYALTFTRPVIFFAPNIEEEQKIDGVHFRDRTKVGFVARDVNQIYPLINQAKQEKEKIAESISKYRKETIFNLGKSREYFIDILEKIMNNEEIPDVEIL